jgi:hypothetical protein
VYQLFYFDSDEGWLFAAITRCPRFAEQWQRDGGYFIGW